MKKQLKEELIRLAENIVSLKQQDHVDTQELKRLAQGLYEKLSILDFTEKHLFSSEASPEVQPEEKKAPKENIRQSEPEEESYRFAPDGTQFSTAEAITEPNTEKIKDIVAQMPPETQRLDDMLAQMMPKESPKESPKEEAEDIGGVHYDKLPQFEPASSEQKEPEKPRSLNDRLKKGIQIGLNDRHAFVRHLFDGSTTDYNRVLSQLNTIKTKEEAVNFVLNMVKPDYNNWEGKEEYEIRFLAVVENKFE